MNNSSQSSLKTNLKIKNPCRNQIEMNFFSLEDRIPLNHKVRAVWDFVDMMDLSILYESISSFNGNPGRKAVNPKVFLALWLYAITEGTFSARKIARECKENDAYRWIVGGVGVNRNNLSSFRNQHSTTFQKVLTECLAVMVKQGILQDEDFSQDGTRIKANAGYSTFRSETSLCEIENTISQLITDIIKAEKNTNDRSEKERLAKEKEFALRRREKVKKALEELKNHKETLLKNAKKNHLSKKESDKRIEKARASIADPEARKMRMGDGGYRISYNVQFATGVDSRVIYGVKVVNTLDPGTLTPMIAQVVHRLGKLGISTPKNWLADSAYSYKSDLDEAHSLFPSLRIVAPTNKDVNTVKVIKKNDSEGVKKWKESIDTESFKEIYKKRCSSAEFSNMHTKAKGMKEVLVRGIQNVTSMCILHAIAFNIARYWDLLK